MRNYFLTSFVVPLLVGSSWGYNPSSQTVTIEPPMAYGYSSEDSSTGSYLGVDISDVTTERLSALKLKEEKGVEVTMVDQDAPAGKAGFKEHDVILRMNGTEVESQVQLKRMIRETPPGRVVAFDISRDGQAMTLKVQLGDRRKQYSWPGPDMKNFHVEIPPISIPNIEVPPINVMVVRSSARSGLMVENITQQLGEFFGVKNGNGVLIRTVEKGSRGEKAGFRAGDVIVKINDQPVHDTGDFTEAMHSQESGSVSISVIRDKKEQNLNLELPPHKESGDLIEEESWGDEPLIDAEENLEMSDARDEGEIAELAPELALVSDETEQQANQAEDALRQGECAARLEAGAKAMRERMEAQSEALQARIDTLRQEQEENLDSTTEKRVQRQSKELRSQKITRDEKREEKRDEKKVEREQERLRIELDRLRHEAPKAAFDI